MNDAQGQERSEWWVNKKTCAQFFGVSLTTIDDWLLKGCPHARHDSGRVSALYLPDVASWRFKASTGRTLDPIAQRARRDSEAADRLALQNQQMRGELLAVDDMAREWARVGNEVKTRMLAMPAKLAPMLVGGTRAEIRGKLEETIDDALRCISEIDDGISASAAPAATDEDLAVGGPAQAAEPRSERGTGTMAN